MGNQLRVIVFANEPHLHAANGGIRHTHGFPHYADRTNDVVRDRAGVGGWCGFCGDAITESRQRCDACPSAFCERLSAQRITYTFGIGGSFSTEVALGGSGHLWKRDAGKVGAPWELVAPQVDDSQAFAGFLRMIFVQTIPGDVTAVTK